MRVVEAGPYHIQDFLTHIIRRADIAEWRAGLGKHPREALPDVLVPGSFVHTLINEDNECICLWGVYHGVDPLVGHVWLIASVEAEERRREIHRLWRAEIAWMHSIRPVLYALADSRNALHLRWLRAVGFTEGGEVPVDPHVPPFILYRREQT